MSTSQSSPSNQKKGKARVKRSRLRIADAKISFILMLVLATFMVLIAAVGGMGAWFLSQNLKQSEVIDTQNKVSRIVYGFGQDMMSLRVSLLVAARYQQDQQEAAGQQSEKLQNEAEAMLIAAKTKLDDVKAAFVEFRKALPESNEGRRLATRIISSYRPYVDDGIDPMVQALESNDFITFYYVNNEFGMPRSVAFEESVEAFSNYIAQEQALYYQEAQASFRNAVIAIAIAVLLGLVLMIIMRVVFGRTVVKPLREAGRHFDRIANGDLTQRVEVRSHNEIGVLYEALRRMQESLTRTVSTVREGVEEITLGSREIFMGNTDLSSRTEHQAASLQETAASMEQLASTVRMNTDNALQADALAKGASDVAERGGQAVSMVVNTMGEISASSHKMAEIVGVIDGIAFQTNILAL
ncbi:Tar ligand binding domain-containing protein, partial [Pusillimonas harenae]